MKWRSRSADGSRLARSRLGGQLAVAAENVVEGALNRNDAAAHGVAALKGIAKSLVRSAVLAEE